MSRIIDNSFYLLSLGCAKNLVDSYGMSHLLKQNALVEVQDPSRARFLIVNTCGFIESARQESFDVLRKLSTSKKSGQFLIAAGCMTQRYQGSLWDQVHGIDAMLGTRRWMDIHHVLENLIHGDTTMRPYLHFPLAQSIGMDYKGSPAIAIQGKSSYLKIADGCRRPCAYCAIPLIKGPLISRSVEDIVSDMLILQDQGIQEVNVIAQDVTDYGHDLGIKDGLLNLLEKLVIAAPNIPWIRLLYTFPGFNVNGLVDLMRAHPQILPYIDIPLQHADPRVLRAMQRPSTIELVKSTLFTLRDQIPGMTLRTTFIVGFPGETDLEFETLINFIKEVRFDHLGAFVYSLEEGTPAQLLGDPIPREIKEERLSMLMETQTQIASQINQTLVGAKMDILIEGVDSQQEILVGRSKRDAPEVDGLVIAHGKGHEGEILKVKINGAIEHDLIGSIVGN
jgi:ribosomal protein S12 methylthiotransferase